VVSILPEAPNTEIPLGALVVGIITDNDNQLAINAVKEHQQYSNINDGQHAFPLIR